MLTLLYPEALALLLPAGWLWWRHAAAGRAAWLRGLVLALLVSAACGPQWDGLRGGSDVVLVLDRSASIPEPVLTSQQELVELTGSQREDGDRLGVVATADGQIALQGPDLAAVPRVADAGLPTGASDLRRGLELAAALIPAGRTGRVVLHSDGQVTGLDPRPAAAALAARGLVLDVLPVAVPDAADAAILSCELPAELRLGESSICAVTFTSDQPARRRWRVTRLPDTVVGEGVVELLPGRAVAVSFADRPVAAGLARYEVELGTRHATTVKDETGEELDRQPANNRARAALRVLGGERVLVMGGTGDGTGAASEGNVGRALRAAGLAVDCVPEGPLDLGRLLAYRALVLEQVPADRLGARGLQAVADWVQHLGGGLVMLGGRRSFGSGGYHNSPVEAVLPVSLELRDEHRKLSVAMAIALDRSGSMGVTVPDGRTKMDLANEGAVAVLGLLGPRDAVAVFAVDTAPHPIFPLTRVDDLARMQAQVRSIDSGGGGIYVYEALVAAGAELLDATQGTRHLLLFADAADAVEPGDYQDLLADYRAQGITVSVIGMGTEADSCAALLKDVAARGGGRCNFAEAPEDIPRLFAQETVLVARSAWIDTPVAVVKKPGLATVLGQQPALSGDWPTVAGYNLTYAKERAEVLAMAPGDPQAPAVASWHIGTGRAAAVALDCDGAGSETLLTWPGYAPLLAGLVRWSAGGGGGADAAGLTAQRAGRSTVLRLELDPATRANWPAAPPELMLVADRPDAAQTRLAMQPVDAGVYEAIAELADEHARLPAALVTGSDGAVRAVLGPALQLPYAPEFAPRLHQRPGAEVLTELARMTGGAVRHDLSGVYANPPSPSRVRPLATWLLVAALTLLLAEIGWRRIGLVLPQWLRHSVKSDSSPTTAAPAAVPPPVAAGRGPDQDQGLHEALRQLRKRRGP